MGPHGMSRLNIYEACVHLLKGYKRDKIYAVLSKGIAVERAAALERNPEADVKQSDPEPLNSGRKQPLSEIEKKCVARQAQMLIRQLVHLIREAALVSHLPAPNREGYQRLIQQYTFADPYAVVREGSEPQGEEGNGQGRGAGAPMGGAADSSNPASSRGAPRRPASSRQISRATPRVWESHYSTRQTEMSAQLMKEALGSEDRLTPSVKGSQTYYQHKDAEERAGAPRQKLLGPYPSVALFRATQQSFLTHRAQRARSSSSGRHSSSSGQQRLPQQQQQQRPQQAQQR